MGKKEYRPRLPGRADRDPQAAGEGGRIVVLFGYEGGSVLCKQP